MGEQEEAVRRDPEVQQARRIAEAARARLLECVGTDDADALAEAQRMLDALREATVLAADAEDRVRVSLGQLIQDEADRRAAARRAAMDVRPRPQTTATDHRCPGRLLAKKPALAALLTAVGAWLAARTLARRRNRGR